MINVTLSTGDSLQLAWGAAVRHHEPWLVDQLPFFNLDLLDGVAEEMLEGDAREFKWYKSLRPLWETLSESDDAGHLKSRHASTAPLTCGALGFVLYAVGDPS